LVSLVASDVTKQLATSTLTNPQAKCRICPLLCHLAHNHTFQCSYSLANEYGTRREIVAESKLANWRPSRTAWTCPGCQPVAGVAGYNIYRGGGGPYSKVNSTPDVDATYTDTTVTAGQTYFYVAKCVDNKSRPSNEMEATVPKPLATPPGAFPRNRCFRNSPARPFSRCR